jgi:PKD repeat protein
LLDVSLQIVPKLVTVGSTAVFIGSSENANTFDWNYGDGSTEILNVPRSSHIYKKSGSYDVTMKVSTSDGKQTNTITRRIHVTDADTPFAIITMKRGNDEILPTPNTCNEQEAFVIDRSSPYTFSADASTNIDGQPVGLSYTWKYLGKTALTKDVSVKFDELGCMPIELTIRSNKNGKTSQTQTFVKLINLPPSLSSITVTADKIETDPVLVKVSAGNAIDPDGAIVSYLWYYWTDSDPEAQDFRVTRAPQTTFVLPKLNGKYYF